MGFRSFVAALFGLGRADRRGALGKKTCAVYVDYENIFKSIQQHGPTPSPGRIIRSVKKFLAQQGLEAGTRRAYARWDSRELSACSSMRAVKAESFETIYAAGEKGDSAADHEMMMDISATFGRPDAPDCCVLASGDQDFLTIIEKVKLGHRHPRQLIVLGVLGSTSTRLRNDTDVMFFEFDPLYDEISKEEKPHEKDDEAKQQTRNGVRAPMLLSSVSPSARPAEFAAQPCIVPSDAPVDPRGVCEQRKPLNGPLEAVEVLFWADELISRKRAGGSVSERELIDALKHRLGSVIDDQQVPDWLKTAVSEGLVVVEQDSDGGIFYRPQDNHHVTAGMRRHAKLLPKLWRDLKHTKNLPWVGLIRLADEAAMSLGYTSQGKERPYSQAPSHLDPLFWLNFLALQGVFKACRQQRDDGKMVNVVELVEDVEPRDPHEERRSRDAAVLVAESTIQYNRRNDRGEWISIRLLLEGVSRALGISDPRAANRIVEQGKHEGWLVPAQHAAPTGGGRVTGFSLEYRNTTVVEVLARYQRVVRGLQEVFKDSHGKPQWREFKDRASILRGLRELVPVAAGETRPDERQVAEWFDVLVAARILQANLERDPAQQQYRPDLRSPLMHGGLRPFA